MHTSLYNIRVCCHDHSSTTNLSHLWELPSFCYITHFYIAVGFIYFLSFAYYIYSFYFWQSAMTNGYFNTKQTSENFFFFSDKPRKHTKQLTSLPRIDSLLIIHWTVSSSNHFDACVGDLYHSLMKWFVRSHWFVCLTSHPVLFILYITWLVYIYY